MKSELRDSINVKMKKKILATLLNGMFAHKSDPVMMRNGCLTLCQFAIPNDVVRGTETEHSKDCVRLVLIVFCGQEENSHTSYRFCVRTK